MERKLFTALQGDNAQGLNDALSQQGFRRSQNVLYRPSCTDCNLCFSARIDVSKFSVSKNQKRIVKRNQYLTRRPTSPWATEEQFDLFRTYLDNRHADGGMADMDVFEFAAMIEETPIRSRVIEYRNEETDLLTAVCLTDVIEDGVSMVYSFYQPDLQRQSLGTFLILDHIYIARDVGLHYVYLGYWVPGSQKMAYKARFSGLELYVDNKWQPYETLKDDPILERRCATDSIAQQVSNITLPPS